MDHPTTVQNDIRHGTINQISGIQINYNSGKEAGCGSCESFHCTYGLVFITDLEILAAVHTHTLGKLQPAKMDATDRRECLSGTRTAMIQFIMDWAQDPVGAQNVLWIHGLAGSGKSTLSTTIASKLLGMGLLGAFLFFDRDVAESSDPSVVVRTMAYQLGSFIPCVAASICAAIEKYPNIHQFPIRSQFNQLLVHALSCHPAIDPGVPIVLVIDALDECGNEKRRHALLESLAEQSSQLPPSVRILITSRPERDLRAYFQLRHHIIVQELDTTSQYNIHDISSYLRIQLLRVQEKTPHLKNRIHWPCDETIARLTDRASGLFIWASTAVDYIDAYDPQKRIDIVLRGDAASGAEIALDTLYRTALESAGSWDDESFVNDFQIIVGIVLVARHPLSSTAIDLLRGKTRGVPCIDVISQLGCALQLHPTVRLMHPSLADFLLTGSRCGRRIWFFGQAIHNRALAMHCLHRLSTVLKQNICNSIPSPDSMREDSSAFIPEDVSYACLYWADHICDIEESTDAVMESLCTFLNKHLLHWLEVMSILNRSRDAIALFDRLHIWLQVNRYFLSFFKRIY